jgi:hypothetical protein
MRPLLGEPGLNSIEQRSVEQRRLWTCQDLPLNVTSPT